MSASCRLYAWTNMMPIYKIVSALLAAAMFSSCSLLADYIDSAGINDVRRSFSNKEIGGLDIPVAYKSPATIITPNKQFAGDVVWYAVGEDELAAALLPFVPDTDGETLLYNMGEIEDDDETEYEDMPDDDSWRTEETGVILSDGAVFQVGLYYKAVITLRAAGSWKVSDVPSDYFTVIGAQATKNAAGSAVVRAYYSPAQADVFSVTFDSNLNGDVSSTQAYPSSYLLSENSKLILPDPPVKPGYIFGGWYLPSDTSGTEYTSSSTVSGNLSLKAKWLSYTITVVFNKNGSEGSDPNPDFIEVKSPQTALGSLPVTLYWDIEGDIRNHVAWNTEADASGSLVNENTVFSATRDELNPTVNVYALWCNGAHAVLFNSNGATKPASTALKTVALDPGTTVTLPEPPIKTNYKFVGWFNEIGTERFYANTAVHQNIMVFAKWSFDRYTVIFDSLGGTSCEPVDVSEKGSAIGMLPVPTKTNYTFGGWFTQANGGGTLITAATVPKADITAYAKWVFTSYTVTFDGDGANLQEPEPDSRLVLVETGGTVALPTIKPRKTNKIFGGWTSNGGTKVFDSNTIISESITVSAKWLDLPDSTWIYVTETGGMYKEISYSESVVNFPPPFSGKYKFELWGAGGGDYVSIPRPNCNATGGGGGYVSGYKTLTQSVAPSLFIYTGKKGFSNGSDPNGGGYSNGGGGAAGNGTTQGGIYEGGAGGGGGTFISTVGGAEDASSVRNGRVLVAGGGGGAAHSVSGGYGSGTAIAGNSAQGSTVSQGADTANPDGYIGNAGGNGQSGKTKPVYGDSGAQGNGGGGGGWYGGKAAQAQGAASNVGGGGGNGYIDTDAGWTLDTALTGTAYNDGKGNHNNGKAKITFTP
ncbi:MAG: hypothetical protein Ta2B_28090 [Termitinemataceae bacterium]|nr:MAG: hypothetical protein Ta2B_28090 [Termitinemataceae bacterium]